MNYLKFFSFPKALYHIMIQIRDGYCQVIFQKNSPKPLILGFGIPSISMSERTTAVKKETAMNPQEDFELEARRHAAQGDDVLAAVADEGEFQWFEDVNDYDLSAEDFARQYDEQADYQPEWME